MSFSIKFGELRCKNARTGLRLKRLSVPHITGEPCLISSLIPMFLFYNSNGNNNPNATTSPGSKSVQNHMYDNVKRNETSDLSLSEQSSFTTSPQTERKDHQNHHQQATSNGSLDRSESPTKLGMVSSKMLISNSNNF